MNGQAKDPDDDISAIGEDETPDAAPDAAAEDESTEEAESDPQSPLDALQAKADENWDRYLRAVAELENVRKRAAKDVENARKFALERFARELLAVKDSFEMGLAATEGETVDSLLEGSAATLKLLSNTLQQFGVVELNPEGEPFDPEFHEAISMQPSTDVEPGSVVTVVQKGYTLNGRLLRPAMVIVAAEQ
ncbi:MAG: nucleotide exchange factor GrpE [Proteobacteria bacterium]|nr:nucleotide exchange factor GrpE [Pseudomonadota bacterium]